MTPKITITREGKLYYSLTTTAKSLGITKANLNKLMSSEGLEWCNFKENGPIWISSKHNSLSWKAIRKKALESKKSSL